MLGICNTTGNLRVPPVDKPAYPGRILEGYEALSPNGLFVMTGTMPPCIPVSDFIATPTTDGHIIFTWTNPDKGPYCGIIIVGSTTDYPTSISQGTKYYQGIGSSPVAEETSSVILDGFTNSTYYFSAFSYTTGSIPDWLGISSEVGKSACRGMSTSRIFTFSDIFTVPEGVDAIDVVMINERSGTNIIAATDVSTKAGDEFIIVIGGPTGYTYISNNGTVIGGIKRNDSNMVMITLK